jgi:hypothetical protein
MSDRVIRACIDRVLPPELQEMAATIAHRENPANPPPRPDEAAVETAKLWLPGRILRVSFLDGHPEVRRRIEQHAREWTRYVHLDLRFVDDADAEIRISCEGEGSWSAVGTDALVEDYFPEDEPTMNFGWLEPDSSDEDYSGVVLHEFGHALGMIHEHQNPAAEIEWNRKVVYRDLGGPPNNWDPEQVRFNVFDRYAADTTQFTDFDPDSIMLYFFPPEWTYDGMTFVENKVLSETDKRFMAERYPGK